MLIGVHGGCNTGGVSFRCRLHSYGRWRDGRRRRYVYSKKYKALFANRNKDGIPLRIVVRSGSDSSLGQGGILPPFVSLIRHVSAGAAVPGAVEYSLGTNALKYPKPGMEVRSAFKDGLIEDWDLLEQLLDFTFERQLRANASDHPLMFSECPVGLLFFFLFLLFLSFFSFHPRMEASLQHPKMLRVGVRLHERFCCQYVLIFSWSSFLFLFGQWNTKAKRETLTELLFEKYKVPALYLAKSAVLSAFASGRSTALVVDGGASSMSVTPVYDGYVLYDGIRRSPLAGHGLSDRFVDMLEKKKEIPIVPHYRVKSKSAVGEAEAAVFVAREHPGLTESFIKYSKRDVVLDFQSMAGRVASPSYNTDLLTTLPTTSHEFPNGYHDSFGLERYDVSELLFDPQKAERDAATAVQDAEMATGAGGASGGAVPEGSRGVHHLIRESVDSCDIDIHNNMWTSIVLTGGTTLYDGFVDRLTSELAKPTHSPVSAKVKILQQMNGAQRQFSPWVGGSILASLGSFQQMWVSREEYEESGKGVVEKKCA